MEEIKDKNREIAGVDEEEVNLLDYWRVIQKHRKLIGRIVLVTVVLTAVVSLFMTNIYQSKALITPVTPKESSASGTLATLTQQFGSLPGMLGLPAPGGTSAAELVNLLKSNIVREKMIEKNNLLPVLFYKQWDEGKKAWKKGGISLNPLVWVSKAIKLVMPGDPKVRKKDDDVPDVMDGLRELEDIITVKNNLKENTITITVDYHDPEMAAKMVGFLLDALNEHMTGESRRVAKINKDYLEDQINKNSDPFIKQKIYFLIAQQIETMMMAEVKENFAFKVLDPPIVPDKKIKPKRTLMVMLSLVVALFIGIFTAFFMEYLEKNNIKVNFSFMSFQRKPESIT